MNPRVVADQLVRALCFIVVVVGPAASVGAGAVSGASAGAAATERVRTSIGSSVSEIQPPVCEPALSSQRRLRGVRSAMVSVGGNPFDVVSSNDGKWSFVSQISGEVAVLADRQPVPKLTREVPLPGTNPTGEAITHDGRYLLVAEGSGAAVLGVGRAERGEPHAVLGQLQAEGSPSAQQLASAIEVAVAPDDRYIFVSLESADEIAVFDFARALRSGFRHSALVGTIRLGLGVVGMAISPNGRWLYATSEAASAKHPRGGIVSVVDLQRAEKEPRHSVVASLPAGCDPVRVAVSPNGRVVWVTARESNCLLAFSASRMRIDPRQALLARVRVGTAPVGLVLLRDGSRILVADSNRFGATGATTALSLIDTRAALAHKPSVLGSIPAGAFPRELVLEPRQRRVLVTNFGSGQLEVIDTAQLP